MLWKLDGLSEYDVRRPMVPTGTNLLGLVKHLASVEFGYFGETFGRPFSERLPWLEEGAEPNADMWATPDESRAEIIGLYHRAWAHSDATIGALALDAIGQVPWWPPERREVTLHRILVHMIAETIGTPDRPTSSASSSTARPGCARTTAASRRATGPGGRRTGTGSRSRPARPARGSASQAPIVFSNQWWA